MRRGADPESTPDETAATVATTTAEAGARLPAAIARHWPHASLLLAVGLAYSSAFTASFQLDDWDVIVRDPRVQSLAAWWHSMPGIRPLLKLSYALNHASGLGVVGFHAVNVAIHAGNALLALWIVRTLLARHQGAAQASGIGSSAESPEELGKAAGTAGPSEIDATSARRVALIAALVFSLHPVQTEAVTYASGRSTSLSAGLALASLLVWARAWEQGRARQRARARDGMQERADEIPATTPSRSGAQIISIGLMLLGIGVKESAVVVPVLIVIWVASDPGVRDPLRAGFGACAAHALALLVGLGALLVLPAYRALAETSFSTRGPLENLVAQVDAIGYLAGQLFRFDRLNADPALEAVTRLDPVRVLAAAAIIGVFVAALASLRRRPLEAFAVLWTFAWLVPTNSLVARLDLVNDRQLYGALLGPALLVSWGIDALVRRAPSPRARRTLRWLFAAVLVAVLGLATHRRNDVYRDELAFWKDVTRKSPHNARAFNNLGFAWAERCELGAAADAWRRALELDPELLRAAVNLRLLDEGAGQAARCRAATTRSPLSREPSTPPP